MMAVQPPIGTAPLTGILTIRLFQNLVRLRPRMKFFSIFWVVMVSLVEFGRETIPVFLPPLFSRLLSFAGVVPTKSLSPLSGMDRSIDSTTLQQFFVVSGHPVLEAALLGAKLRSGLRPFISELLAAYSASSFFLFVSHRMVVYDSRCMVVNSGG